ncbi:MAG: winged helix-turn-helix transcriptional regulator [Candidatus Thermoplasmatota archaeon]|nr:winged helix-turn-helix transcriptional regulator [Candidatus Thermoplasmatota archaeon]
MEPIDILGSKARLEILHQLSEKDMYVSELMDKVGMDGKTAKHHLQIMEEEGLLSSRKENRRKYYSLKREIILRISPSPNKKYQVQFHPIKS